MLFGVIISANRIELMKEEFWMYKEALTPSIWNLVEQLDNEKNDVIERCKGERISYLDACKFRNVRDLSVEALSVFRSYAEHGGPTVLTNSLITIASLLVKKQFYEQKRTLEDFGLCDISFNDFVKLINS